MEDSFSLDFNLEKTEIVILNSNKEPIVTLKKDAANTIVAEAIVKVLKKYLKN